MDIKCPHGKTIEIEEEYGIMVYKHSDSGKLCGLLNKFNTKALTIGEKLCGQRKTLELEDSSVFYSSMRNVSSFRVRYYHEMASCKDDLQLARRISLLYMVLLPMYNEVFYGELMHWFGSTIVDNFSALGFDAVGYRHNPDSGKTGVLKIKNFLRDSSTLDAILGDIAKHRHRFQQKQRDNIDELFNILQSASKSSSRYQFGTYFNHQTINVEYVVEVPMRLFESLSYDSIANVVEDVCADHSQSWRSQGGRVPDDAMFKIHDFSYRMLCMKRQTVELVIRGSWRSGNINQ